MTTIASLIHEQEVLKERINKLVYGSVEIRESGEKKY